MKLHCHGISVFAGVLISTAAAFGQGCIVARSSAQLGGPGTDGGYIGKGECSIAIGYRHQFSQRHFVGDTEQTQRMAKGTQVMNRINLENVNLTYQASPRYSFTVSAPILSASRRSNNSPYTTDSHGFGDIIVTANGWLFDPTENTKGNVQFGLGTMLPTGASNLIQNVDKLDGKGLVPVVLDYSVQPGSGGYGMVFQWQSYRNLGGKTQLFFNGSYIATPQNTNSTVRNLTGNPASLTYYNSISDQYLLEAGVARAFTSIRGLNVFVGPRWEGVPAQDLIGDSLGFRRPGYALSIAPGVQYTWRKHIFSASVGKAIHRDRTRSIPDRITGGHGDAAFADYVWLASYTFRFNTRSGISAHHDMPQHESAHDVAAEHQAMK